MIEESSLPPDLALLWQVRGTSRRGPKPVLTLADITRAAIEVADAEGLEAVSMARVAAHLGNATMALYRHVKSKTELLMLMSDTAVGTPPDLPRHQDWRTSLRLWARSAMASYRRHPWLAEIPVTGPPFGPGNLRWLDRGLAALDDTGLSGGEKLALTTGLITYIRGAHRMAAELRRGYEDNPVAFSTEYIEAMKRLVSPREYPALSKAVAAGLFDGAAGWDEDADYTEFELGLDVHLDGIAAYIARRAT